MPHSKHMTDIRKPYSGLSRSLVIAIDVGTTFSGVSYAILEPGEIPKIHGVTRFPGQEHVAGNSKIPSVIFYDKYGAVKAAGAEVDNTSVLAQAEDEGWIKAELFKLRLRPRTMQLNMNGMRLSPLPKRKTPVHVFGDFLSYMYRCTRSFICDTHANGLTLWNSVERDIQFVLSHPNGWEGPQQTRMRNAAVYGKLVPDTDAGRARIRFVTEGEASLHACVLSGLASEVLSNPSKHGFLIADAGGGTLDISAYAVKGTSPLTIEEIAPPDCIFAGSVFVSRRAREFLEEKLRNSKYGTPDSLDHITRKFDETTKRLFRDRNELQFIPFGSPLDKDSAVGIRSGQLRLSGNEVANLFEPSVDAAVTAIKKQIEASRGLIRSVFLVGGYAASPWLFQQLSERLAPLHVAVSRPDTQTSKAVADGAIGFYCDHHVSARMSKFMYGVEFLRALDPNDPDHVARKDRLCELPSGPKLLPDAFDCILARGVKVKESTVFTRKYCTELTNLSMLSVFEVEIWCFRGGDKIPMWINRHDEKFSTLCIVQADLSLLNGSAEPKAGTNGKKYWTIVFSVEIHFGLTEFKARIKWMDKGQVKYGPAVIVYNERGHRIEDEDLDVYPEDDQSYHTSRSGADRRGGGEGMSSRPRTPINQYPPPSMALVASGGSRHDASAPGPIEKSSSRGYTPSIVAPSISQSASYRSATDRSLHSAPGGGPSDSERKKGKERGGEERFDDNNKYSSAAYGQSPISRSTSNNATGPDPYASTWGSSTMMMSGSSPSGRPPHSRSVSFYDGQPPPSAGGAGTGAQDFHQSDHSAWGPGVLSSTVDDHHHHHDHHHHQQQQQEAYGWDNNPNPNPGPSPQRSQHAAQLDAILDRPRSPYPPGPPGPPPPSGHPADPRPKSAFGDPQPLVFGNEPPAPMFGHTGEGVVEASAPGTSTALFGEPPVSVFGATAAASPGGGVGGAGAGGGEDNWNFSTPVTTPGKKSKKKTTSALGTPSGLTSRTSPSAALAPKSPLADTIGGVGGSPASGGGLLGSKAPSPYGKPLSPLNPASQVNNNEPVGEEHHYRHEEDAGAWGFDGGHQSAGGGGGWGGTVDYGDQFNKPPSKEPSPNPPVVEPPPVSPIPPTPEDRDIGTVGGKKKKKKGAAAGSLSFGAVDEEPERKGDKKDKKFEPETTTTTYDAAEEKKQPDTEAGGAGQSLFGGPTSTFGTFGWGGSGETAGAGAGATGGGEDSWGSSWGMPKKKGKGGASGQSTGFGTLGSGWGSNFGSGATFGDDTEGGGGGGGDSTNVFDFSSGGHNLGFSIGGAGDEPLSGNPDAAGEMSSVPLGDAGDGAPTGDAGGGGAEGGGEEDGGSKKKKKKGKKGAELTEEPQIGAVTEDPTSQEPTSVAAAGEPEDNFAPVSGKKKKGKKK